MKKVIVGLGAVGALIALRPVAGRKHCERMAGKCKQMMASQSGQHSGAPGMREHCQEMMAAHRGHGQKTATHEHPEQKAPQFCHWTASSERRA
jgi:hypothetical protein